MAMADERGKAIDLAFAQIEKQFGKGSIMRLGSKEIVPIAVIPTGAISFDAALGVGGMLGYLGGRNPLWGAVRQLLALCAAALATWGAGRLFNVTVT